MFEVKGCIISCFCSKKSRDSLNLKMSALFQIASEMTDAQQKSNETVAEVDGLQMKLKNLQTRFLKNERDAREVSEEAATISTEARRAQERASELQSAYKNAEELLKRRSSTARESQEKVSGLLKKASELSLGTMSKLKELKGELS
jgi:chromosome segregation ATPase